MEVSKIIYGRVGPRGTYTEGMITEEDYGILFQMPDLDLPAAYQVDFSNKLTGGTALTVVGNEDGALIPTSLIDSTTIAEPNAGRPLRPQNSNQLSTRPSPPSTLP